MSQAALDGIKVLDLTQFESGTVCTETLAWLGAEIIKVERPERGELGRYSHEEPGVDALGFILVNANKKSITLDMKTAKGKEILRQLILKCDIFIENMGPGAIERLGFGYDEVKEINPRIVYAQIKGFGKGSPWENFPAFEPIAEATGGSASLTGEPEGPPLQPGADFADSGSGYLTAIAILAALIQRNSTGVGQQIEVAMQDVVIGFCRASFEKQLRYGKATPRSGNGMALDNVAPCNKYPCSPGGPNDYVHAYASRAPGSNQWKLFCETIGRMDLYEDTRFATPQSRFPYRHEIDAAISEWTMQRTKFEAMEALGSAGVPAGAVMSTDDITNDPFLRERGIITEIEHPVRGKLSIPGFAPKMSDSFVKVTCAPALGQHNQEILEGLLGLSCNDIELLKKDKII